MTDSAKITLLGNSTCKGIPDYPIYDYGLKEWGTIKLPCSGENHHKTLRIGTALSLAGAAMGYATGFV